LIIFVTFCVILFTLVVQSLTLPALIRKLKVVRGGKRPEVEEAEARLEVLEAAFAYLDQSEGDPDRVGLRDLRQQFERQRDHLQARIGPARTAVVRVASVCKRLYGGAISAQRNRLIELWKTGRVPDEALHRIQREIDLEESRLRLFPDLTPQGEEARVALPREVPSGSSAEDLSASAR
jgi:CPA1 family monovalent cation:H+ antiporter